MKTFIVAKVIGGTEQIDAEAVEISPNGDLIFGSPAGITRGFAANSWDNFWVQQYG